VQVVTHRVTGDGGESKKTEKKKMGIAGGSAFTGGLQANTSNVKLQRRPRSHRPQKTEKGLSRVENIKTRDLWVSAGGGS